MRMSFFSDQCFVNGVDHCSKPENLNYLVSATEFSNSWSLDVLSVLDKRNAKF